MAHVYLAAAHKSSGKTSLAIGLTAALAARGLIVQPFKKGPDYIDPIWLARAAGRPCYNLDFFTQSAAEIRELFVSRSGAAEISIIEGNKGLFDGLSVDGSDSNAALAALLSAPVVLVIDCTGMTRGIAPLLHGYLGFEPRVGIGGVVLNKVGGARHESKLRAAIERYTEVPVLGVLGRDAALEIPERHLGLVPANEFSNGKDRAVSAARAADRMIGRLARAASSGVDLDRIMELARAAVLPTMLPDTRVGAGSGAGTGSAPPVRIAIARDGAFGFYYPDDLEAFAAAGAQLVPFDTSWDARLPECDGLFIGGGFPETRMAALAANRPLREDIRRALRDGMPAYAECGGLMYLCQSIRWRGEHREMVGAVPADVVVEQRPQGRGYMLLKEAHGHPWPTVPESVARAPAPVPAHEFHHARLENLPPDVTYAWRVTRGAGIDGVHDGIVVGNLLAGFSHHRDTAADRWVERFLRFVRQQAF